MTISRICPCQNDLSLLQLLWPVHDSMFVASFFKAHRTSDVLGSEANQSCIKNSISGYIHINHHFHSKIKLESDRQTIKTVGQHNSLLGHVI